MSFTVMVNVSLSTRLPVPLSVTVMVTDGVVLPSLSVGVQLKSPVAESIVIGQQWQDDVRVVLFVKLVDGLDLDDELIQKIKLQIRKNTTPRHVPAKVLQVQDIPRTKSGKIVELAVRSIVHGETIKNIEALANPEALDEYASRSELEA